MIRRLIAELTESVERGGYNDPEIFLRDYLQWSQEVAAQVRLGICARAPWEFDQTSPQRPREYSYREVFPLA